MDSNMPMKDRGKMAAGVPGLGAGAARMAGALAALPLLVKVTAIVVVLTLLLMAGLFWQVHGPWHAMALRDLDSRGRFVAHEIAECVAPFIREGKPDAALAEVQRVASLFADLDSVEIHDAAGEAVVKMRGHAAGHGIRAIRVPLPGGAGGAVSVTMDRTGSDREVAWLTGRLHAMGLAFACLGLAGAWSLTRRCVRPIEELVAATRAVKGGDYEARAPVRASDETGELAVAFNDMIAALHEKVVINRHLTREAIAATEAERKRLARELHDHTGQALASLIAGLAALESGASTATLADLRALASQTLRDVHDLSLALRPAALDDLGLVPALAKHCRSTAARFGVGVTCSAIGLDNGARLPGEIEVALYRIAQEAIANALRHGRARSIDVLLQRKAVSVLAVIEDDGRGFDAEAWRARAVGGGHLGLLHIDERATLLGGTFRVESRPGAGTSLFVEIPLTGEAHV